MFIYTDIYIFYKYVIYKLIEHEWKKCLYINPKIMILKYTLKRETSLTHHLKIRERCEWKHSS